VLRSRRPPSTFNEPRSAGNELLSTCKNSCGYLTLRMFRRNQFIRMQLRAVDSFAATTLLMYFDTGKSAWLLAADQIGEIGHPAVTTRGKIVCVSFTHPTGGEDRILVKGLSRGPGFRQLHGMDAMDWEITVRDKPARIGHLSDEGAISWYLATVEANPPWK